MPQFTCIDCNQANNLIENGAVLFDIRDQGSFSTAHPLKALNLNNENMQQLLQPLKLETPILVLCYHGISSKSAAEYIGSLGYTSVHSIDGGFEAWSKQFPNDLSS